MTPGTSPPISPATRPIKPEKRTAPTRRAPAPKTSERIEIEPVEGEFGKILKRPGE